MDADGSMRYEDADGSCIHRLPDGSGDAHNEFRGPTQSVSFFVVMTPLSHQGGTLVTDRLYVIAAKEPNGDTVGRMMAWLLGAGASEGVVMGVDTESGQAKGDTCTLQLVLGDRAIVVHVPHNKAALTHSSLVRLFANSDESIIFAGAELAVDALELAAETKGLLMHGGLDFTPLYTDLAAPAAKKRGDPVGLRVIVNERLCGPKAIKLGRPTPAQLDAAREWVKDKNITCSEWGAAAPLSLAQVKYCVLDAWASCRIGCDALQRLTESHPKLSPTELLSQKLFTLRGVDGEVIASFGRALREADALKDAQRKAHEVTVEAVEFDDSAPRKLIIRMADYDKRLRMGYPITFVLSPRPTLALEKQSRQGGFAACGEEGSVHIPFRRPFTLAGGKLAPYGIDGRSANILLDPSSVTGRQVWNHHSINARSVAVLTNNHGDRDHSLEAVERCIKAAIRAHTLAAAANARVVLPLRLRQLPSVPAGSRLDFVVGASMATGTAFCNLLGLSPTASSSAQQLLQSKRQPELLSDAGALADVLSSNLTSATARNAIAAHAGRLNPSQRLALIAAHVHRVTALRGPPGTGKTSTIAAICRSFVMRPDIRRVLVLAPSNAATKRILESLVEKGYEGAALVVSREFYFEWHELMYKDNGIEEYVVTPEASDDDGRDGASSFRSGFSSFTTGSRGGRAVTKARPSKWTDPEAPALPEVVIMSHGAFMMATLDAISKPDVTASAAAAAGSGSVGTDGGASSGGGGGGTVATHAAASIAKRRLVGVGGRRGSVSSLTSSSAAGSGGRGTAAGALSSAKDWGAILRAVTRFETIGAVVLDEVSQLWEGHLLSLTANPALPSVNRLVLVGDEHQLPPYGSDESGAVSAFASLIAHPSVPLIQLSTSYRLPSAIGRLLSRRIYDGRLQFTRSAASDGLFAGVMRRGLAALGSTKDGVRLAAEIKLLQRLLGSGTASSSSSSTAVGGGAAVTSPLAWLEVSDGKESKEDTSTKNDVEATAVARLSIAARLAIQYGKRLVGGEAADRNFRVVAISPYKAQQIAIEDAIAQESVFLRSPPGLLDGQQRLQRKDVKSQKLVTTVDGFQGQEADIMLVSTVRTKPQLSDFMLDYRRMNVTLSRAMQMMVMVGDHGAISSVSGVKPARAAASVALSRGSLLTETAKQCAAEGLVFSLAGGQVMSAAAGNSAVDVLTGVLGRMSLQPSAAITSARKGASAPTETSTVPAPAASQPRQAAAASASATTTAAQGVHRASTATASVAAPATGGTQGARYPAGSWEAAVLSFLAGKGREWTQCGDIGNHLRQSGISPPAGKLSKALKSVASVEVDSSNPSIPIARLAAASTPATSSRKPAKTTAAAAARPSSAPTKPTPGGAKPAAAPSPAVIKAVRKFLLERGVEWTNSAAIGIHLSQLHVSYKGKLGRVLDGVPGIIQYYDPSRSVREYKLSTAANPADPAVKPAWVVAASTVLGQHRGEWVNSALLGQKVRAILQTSGACPPKGQKLPMKAIVAQVPGARIQRASGGVSNDSFQLA